MPPFPLSSSPKHTTSEHRRLFPSSCQKENKPSSRFARDEAVLRLGVPSRNVPRACGLCSHSHNCLAADGGCYPRRALVLVCLVPMQNECVLAKSLNKVTVVHFIFAFILFFCWRCVLKPRKKEKDSSPSFCLFSTAGLSSVSTGPSSLTSASGRRSTKQGREEKKSIHGDLRRCKVD